MTISFIAATDTTTSALDSFGKQDYPAGMQVGDLLVTISTRASGSGQADLPSGFTNHWTGNSSAGSGVGMRVAMRVVDGTETGVISHNIASGTRAVCLLYRGATGLGAVATGSGTASVAGMPNASAYSPTAWALCATGARNNHDGPITYNDTDATALAARRETAGAGPNTALAVWDTGAFVSGVAGGVVSNNGAAFANSWLALTVELLGTEGGGGDPPQGTVTISGVTPGETSADVSYSYNETDETGFEYRLDGGTAASLGASPATISGLTASTTYNLEIRAINANGSGAWSAVSNFTTAAPPAVDLDWTLVPAITARTTTSYTLTAEPTEACTVYAVAVPVGATTPTGAQIVAGTDGTATAAAATDSAVSTGTGGPVTLTLSGLGTAPAYDIHVVGYAAP